MNPKTSMLKDLLAIMLRSVCVLTIILLWMGAGVMAQTVTGGSTPSGLKPGAPAGSYGLSGFENVNLFNGNLNFNLPLLKVGGRGGSGMQMTVSIDSVKWTVENSTIEGTESSSSCGNPNGSPWIQGCQYLPMTAPPGGNPQAESYPEPDWWGGLRVGYGPGVLQGRFTANTMGAVYKSLIRLTFTAPGGTEYELRDLATNGRPYGAPGYGWQPPSNHGLTYVSQDGSVTFTPDQQIVYVFGRGTGLISPSTMTGYLYTADGTRYRIENGLVLWTRDRNGNKLTFTYYGTTSSPLSERRVNTITDSLGRVTTIYYADSQTAYDRIVFTGFGGTTQQEIKVYRKHLSQTLRTTRTGDLTTARTFGQLFTELLNQGGAGSTIYDPDDVIAQIMLPDNRSYKLFYNVYNELARVELPTGGAIEYDYTPTGSSVIWGIYSGPQIHRRVTERRLYADGTSSAYESRQTYTPTYTVTSYSGSTPTFWETTVEVRQYGASDLMNSEKHTFFWSPVASLSKAPVSYSGWKEGKEKKTEYFDAQGTALRRVQNTWEQCTQCELDMSWWTPTSVETTDHGPSNNPHITASVTTLLDVSPNLVSKQTFQYDKYNNLTDSYDYDYNLTVAAAYPVRHTKADYLTTNNSIDYTATSVHIRNLPTMQRVYSVNPANGAETLAAKSETVYDESTYQVNEGYGTITGWEAPPTPAARGNATTSRGWYDVNSSNSYIETHVQYDQCGNVRMAWDGRNKVSEIQYSATYNYALPTKTKSPKPDSEGTTGSSSELETTSVYDFSTGLVTSTTDANNQTTSIEYNDVLNRPTKVTRPSGGGWTSFEYGDAIGNLYVRTQTALDASRTLEAYQYFDGLGRSWRSSPTEGTTSILADTQYDALGRVWKVSNPYRTGDTVQWTTTSYDSLGRVTSVKTPDNAEVLSAYSGNTMTLTDQAGKQRKSVTDALGRLTSIYEAPNDTTNFNFQTNYLYDVLGNLRTVTQGPETQLPQTRTFVYDSLSRLTSAINPESGTTNYSYDGNGNLLTKTDARYTTAHFTYDGLNRVTQRSYDGASAFATPIVNYFYDATTVTNSKGRLTSVSSSVSGYNYSGYDALGRITASQQVTDGQTYSMSYQYDLAGNMTSQTYPTGRVVTQSFDNAGRLANISGQASGGTPKTYANSFGYSPHGAIEHMRLGNGRFEHTSFNTRLQPTEIGLGSSATDSSVLKLNYEYGTTANNGNVLKQIITVPTIGVATGFTATQHYQCDQLNRLTGAQEVNGASSNWQTSGTLWQQKFTYDQFGNRAVDTANTTSSMIGPNPQISTSTNRIVPRTSPVEYYQYDSAGNMTKGQSGDTLDYDAENKFVQYQGGATQSGGANYSYDGDGKRVKKATPAETMTFVYNIGGQLVAEYTTSTPEQNGTSYLTSDTLGSPRVITKADGSVRARHDYLPFGEELYASAGNRTTGQKYDDSASPTDKTRQKFTQKERDIETGLAYFGARYLSSTQGRFISVDPALTSANVATPQSWNRYAYGFNNPLKYIDPTGAWNWSATLGGSDSDADLLSNAGTDKKKIKAANKIIDQRNLFRNALADAKAAGPSSDVPDSVARAVNAFGSEGDKNGVTVTFGTTANGIAAEAGASPNGALSFNANGSVTAQVLVTISSSVTNANELAQAVGHEGWHTADRQSFAAYLTRQFQAVGGAQNFGTADETRAFNSPYNRTVQTTELGAYIVSGLIAQGRDALGKKFPNSNFNGHEVWNNSWSAAERPGLRAVGAFEHVTTSPTYANRLTDRQFPH